MGLGAFRTSRASRFVAPARELVARAPSSGGLSGLVLLVGLSVVPQVPRAQDAEFEEITVTGSRIARPDYTSASPIVSVTQELFERTGSSTVETAINTLPQFVPGFTSTSNNPANGGQANVQLRGLGSTSTLVLIDGKRLIPANGSGVVDLNIIPGSLIESVEIITGGASAVYGSDAVAGVVNFRLKNEFDGIEFDAHWGQTDREDGADWGGGVTAGLAFADGRGSVLGYVGYSEREAIFAAEREFSRYALFYDYEGQGSNGTLGPGNAFVSGGSGAIEEGRAAPLRASADAFNSLFASYGFPSVPYQTAFGFNTDGTLFTGGNFTPGSVVNFRGEKDPVAFDDSFYSYNFAPVNYLQLPLERASAFARAAFEITDSVELYAQGLYAEYTVETQLAPAATFDGMFLPVTNPFIPPDLKLLLDSRLPDPAADMRMVKRLSELGPRISSFEYEVYQATVGLRGTVFTEWSYDVYLQIGANDQTETQSGNALLSKIEELTHAPDGGVSICGGFDPFGLESISAECAAYIAFGGTNRAAVDQTIAEASMTGPVLSLPAGELRVALGAFYKKDEYLYDGDPIAAVFLPDGRPDVQGFLASDDIKGDDSNTDLYVEASVPLLADLPGVRMLEFVAGYRYSDYDSAGGADAYKAELIYQPVEPLRLRSSFQHAVRAPSVFELYLPQLPWTFGGFFDPFDPCVAGSDERSGPDAAQVEALCVAQGVPAAVLPTFELPDNDGRGFVGGNPDLDPEEADTLTIGLVFTSPSASPWLDRLQVSLDWYRIELEDAIVTVFFDEFVGRCFDRTHNPSFELANPWCAMFARNPADGDIVDAYEIFRNSEGFETSGVDLQLDWRFDLGPGELRFNWLVSYLDSFEQLEAAGIPPVELAGTAGPSESFIGRSLPEWKWSFGVSYDWQALTLDARWRYIDGMKDADPTLDPVFRIPSYDYFDIGASYDFSEGFLDGLQLRAGVENLTDEDPPVFPSYAQANTDPSQYDVLGRRYYLSLNYRF
jgi:outer membrane receptor protein involved in Fe transport